VSPKYFSFLLFLQCIMGIVVRLLCISLLVGICLAVNGTPQPKAQAPLEPRMTEISKLSQKIQNAAAKKDFPEDDAEDCHEPPPRRCRWYQPPVDRHDPNSPGWVRANVVGMGQLPDDIHAHLPRWITARTVPFLPEAASTGQAGSPCCICPQCGLSFYTPNDYWGHLPTCPVPGPRECVQTTPCLGNSHFNPDPRVCMCVSGPAPSSSAAPVLGAGATGTGGVGSAGSSGSSTG